MSLDIGRQQQSPHHASCFVTEAQPDPSKHISCIQHLIVDDRIHSWGICEERLPIISIP
jgi:hypothetical protein